MARSTTAEYALGRALTWLRWSGVPSSPEVIRIVLAMVEQAVTGEQTELIQRVMTELPQRIATPEVRLPPAALPIKRSSLGYARYL